MIKLREEGRGGERERERQRGRGDRERDTTNWYKKTSFHNEFTNTIARYYYAMEVRYIHQTVTIMPLLRTEPFSWPTL